jgi:hypothetical protein
MGPEDDLLIPIPSASIPFNGRVLNGLGDMNDDRRVRHIDGVLSGGALRGAHKSSAMLQSISEI